MTGEGIQEDTALQTRYAKAAHTLSIAEGQRGTSAEVNGINGCFAKLAPPAGLRDGVRLLSERHPLRLRPRNEK